MQNRDRAVVALFSLVGLPSCSLLMDWSEPAESSREAAGAAGVAGTGRFAGSPGGSGAVAGATSIGTQNGSGGTTLVAGSGGVLASSKAVNSGGSAGALPLAGQGGVSVSTAGGVGGATLGAGGIGDAPVSAGAAGTAGAGAVAGAGTKPSECPGTGGPEMVKLPQGVCIDSTEVTRAQYLAWLNTITTDTVTSQDQATCGWNTRLAPDSYCMTTSNVCQGTRCGNHPQVCIDWCDAIAYCRGVGKRLCGKIGGGATPYDQFGSATISQWYTACSSVGANTYPYGYGYRPALCNDYLYWGEASPTTLEVASLGTCQAQVPYSGVYDLSGNVQEWEDSCDPAETGPFGDCLTRGCHFGCGDRALTCSGDRRPLERVEFNEYTGLRCCGL